MTDRGLPIADGSPACPFVAFEDDRDERAGRPDHRHRCFAEAVPAPRALAHQEAYCLSSAFPVCPTFQEWARREAAHADPGRAGPPNAAREVTADAASDPAADGEDGVEDQPVAAVDEDDAEDPWSVARDVPIEDRPRRNPPRDWAAPPPWAGAGGGAGAAGAGSGGAAPRSGRQHDDPGASVPEEGRGLVGSAADRLASGEDPDHAWLERAGHPDRADDGPSAPADPELASLVGRSVDAGGRRDRAPGPRADDEVDAIGPPSRPSRRPAVSSTRDRSRERERDRERERVAAERDPHDGPSWERSRRSEAYPSIRARVSSPGIPQLPRIGVLLGALVVAAFLLFLLPTLLNIGGKTDNGGGATASASGAAPSASVEPTPVPEPTPVVYTIKAGDTLNKIAKKYNVTVQQIEDANKDTIKDPNRIKVGDKIVIPTPPPAEVPAASAAATASP
jgi:LysM repeat protein